jgi:hypothetical protein
MKPILASARARAGVRHRWRSPLKTTSYNPTIVGRENVTDIRKPKRVWALQLVAGFQLMVAIAGTASVLSSGIPPVSVPALFFGFARPVLAMLLLPPLILSLQRLLPRPDRLAPVLAAAGAILIVAGFVFAEPRPLHPSVQALMFEDVPAEAARFGAIFTRSVAFIALFLAVASLFVHRRTRAYLSSR